MAVAPAFHEVPQGKSPARMTSIRVSQIFETLSLLALCPTETPEQQGATRSMVAGPVAIHMETMRPDSHKRVQCHKEGVWTASTLLILCSTQRSRPVKLHCHQVVSYGNPCRSRTSMSNDTPEFNLEARLLT